MNTKKQLQIFGIFLVMALISLFFWRMFSPHNAFYEGIQNTKKYNEIEASVLENLILTDEDQLSTLETSLSEKVLNDLTIAGLEKSKLLHDTSNKDLAKMLDDDKIVMLQNMGKIALLNEQIKRYKRERKDSLDLVKKINEVEKKKNVSIWHFFWQKKSDTDSYIKRIIAENNTKREKNTPLITSKHYTLPAGTIISTKVDKGMIWENGKITQALVATITQDVVDSDGKVIIPKGAMFVDDGKKIELTWDKSGEKRIQANTQDAHSNKTVSNKQTQVKTGCTFEKANLSNAQLQDARFIGCDFTDAQLSGANIDSTIFEHCQENGHPITKEWLKAQGAKNVLSAKIIED